MGQLYVRYLWQSGQALHCRKYQLIDDPGSVRLDGVAPATNPVNETPEVKKMKVRLAFTIAAMLLLSFSSTTALAQDQTSQSSADVASWVAYWAAPPVILYGHEEDAFYKNMKGIMFLRNDYDSPTNPGTLDDNVQWLKDHPSVRFYVDGYASITGDVLYNLALSQRRAEWVKQTLVSRGISENRIVVAAGWGELYPACAENTQECRDKNKLVRFVYSPN
jgi:outer membrane protein OmpA-like peptidoglycan-associated protein